MPKEQKLAIWQFVFLYELNQIFAFLLSEYGGSGLRLFDACKFLHLIVACEILIKFSFLKK